MTTLAVSILLCYGLADQLGRLIGKTGMSVILRLSSFMLVCIGVQIMWNGMSAILSSLHIQAPLWVVAPNMRSNRAWNRGGRKLRNQGTARIRAWVILAQKLVERAPRACRAQN